MLGIDFSKYTVANYVSMAFGITYLVLTIIALVAMLMLSVVILSPIIYRCPLCLQDTQSPETLMA